MKDFKEIVSYPYQIKSLLMKDNTVAQLILNDVNADPRNEVTESLLLNSIFDYSFVEEIVQDTKSFICVDVEFPWQSTDTITSAQLVVLIGVSRSIINLDNSKFKGVLGNRLANLFVAVNSVITNSGVGIGTQHLQTGKSYVVSKDFACKQIVYDIPNISCN